MQEACYVLDAVPGSLKYFICLGLHEVSLILKWRKPGLRLVARVW